MMIFFNKVGNSWVAKGIFTVLALSMVAFWGIGGLSNTTRYSDEAVRVGNKKVAANQLLQAFEQERQKLNGLAGGYISPKKAVEMGLAAQVVRQQVNTLINDEVKEALGLTASNAAVQKYVENNPAFADALGKFDKNLFYAYLRQAKMTESELAEKLQSELAMQHLAYAVKSIAYAPEKLVRLTYKYQNEKRDVAALLIETDKIQLNKQPTDTDLKDYFEAYSDQFMAPEYRSFNVVRLTPEMMLNRVQVSDQEIDAVYNERKNQYTTPEKRAVSQMRFETEAAARSALQGLTPDNFAKVAADKLGQTSEQTDFGYIIRDELLEELMEPVFTASRNQIVGPVESPLGWHVLLVRDIQAAKTIPEKEIRSEIRTSLAREKTYDTMYETVKQIEDILGAGDSLERVSEQLDLPLLTIDRVDVSGVSADGTTLSEDVNNKEMLQNVFTIQKGDTTLLIENGTGYLVAQLTDIIPVSQKEFKDVRSDLVRLWTSEQQKDQLEKTADQILDRIHKGESLSAQGVFGNFEIIQVNNISREDFDRLPQEAVSDVFMQKTGIENAIMIPVSKGILIAVTNRVSYPDLKEGGDAYRQVEASLKDAIGTELMGDIVSSYADTFGVSVNEAEVRKIFSIYSSDVE